MRKLSKIYQYLIYIMPLCLYFSYFPVISLGGNETMNFELSVALVWLVAFDAVSAILMAMMWSGAGAGVLPKWRCASQRSKWLAWGFPIWCAFSVIWSLNVTRGILTAGVLGLLYIAIMGLISARKVILDFNKFKKGFWQWFLGATMVACLWCVVQCVLDLCGVPRETSLLCQGCTYVSFGFPHPNGWAIEPQFMGNLLLAPVLVAGAMVVNGGLWTVMVDGGAQKVGNDRLFGVADVHVTWKVVAMLLITTATLFLTMSRGAIYAMVVGLICLSAFAIAKNWRVVAKRAAAVRGVAIMWGVVIVAFICTLNGQGLMAQLSPTNDTYVSGVAKVLNHLSLGVVDVRSAWGVRESSELSMGEMNASEVSDDKVVSADGVGDAEVVERGERVEWVEPVELEHDGWTEQVEQAIFDGYVEESTNVRMELTRDALSVWSQNPLTMLVGVGLGGVGQALYNNGLTATPKEIVQNEYASLLLEVGVIGVVLAALVVVMVVRVYLKSPAGGVLLSLILAYGVSLCFFSGLTNALQIYLLPAVIWAVESLVASQPGVEEAAGSCGSVSERQKTVRTMEISVKNGNRIAESR